MIPSHPSLPPPAGAKNVYPGVGVIMVADGEMGKYYQALGITAAKASFTAHDAAECSGACNALATKRAANLCHAWTFSRKPGQSGEGQCQLLTKPNREGYFAFGVAWPVELAGSIMGTMDNKPLKVGGEAKCGLCRRSALASIRLLICFLFLAGFVPLEGKSIEGNDLLDAATKAVVRVANGAGECATICRGYAGCGGITFESDDKRVAGVCRLKADVVVDRHILGKLLMSTDTKSYSGVMLRRLVALPKRLNSTPFCSPAPGACQLTQCQLPAAPDITGRWGLGGPEGGYAPLGQTASPCTCPLPPDQTRAPSSPRATPAPARTPTKCSTATRSTRQ